MDGLDLHLLLLLHIASIPVIATGGAEIYSIFKMQFLLEVLGSSIPAWLFSKVKSGVLINSRQKA